MGSSGLRGGGRSGMGQLGEWLDVGRCHGYELDV